MRVWIVNHYAYGPFHSAGNRHFSLARELVSRGYEVLIITTSFFHKTREETRLNHGQTYRHEDIDGVRFLWLRTPPYVGNDWRRGWNMAVFAWRVWRRTGLRGSQSPAVVLGSSPSLLGAYAARRLARRLRLPFVLEVRDLWPDMLVTMSKLSERHPFIRFHAFLERRLYRSSDAIITVLPGAGPRIREKGGEPSRIYSVPNGADLSRIPSAPRQPKGRSVTFMYAGAHGPAQALDTVLDAAAIVQEEYWGGRVRFELIGEGSVKQELEERANRLGLENVWFRPAVPRSEIYSYLREADAFILTLKDSPVFQWGVSPNKLFDYLAMSRPTIFAVNTPFNPVKEADAGLTIPAEEPRALAQAVRQICEMDAGERRAMGARGRKHVEEVYDIRKQVHALEEILRTAVQGAEAESR